MSRLMHDRAVCDGFAERTRAWVRLALADFAKEYGREETPNQVAAHVLRCSAKHIRETIPTVDGLADDFEVEHMVSICQRAMYECIDEWKAARPQRRD